MSAKSYGLVIALGVVAVVNLICGVGVAASLDKYKKAQEDAKSGTATAIEDGKPGSLKFASNWSYASAFFSVLAALVLIGLAIYHRSLSTKIAAVDEALQVQSPTIEDVRKAMGQIKDAKK